MKFELARRLDSALNDNEALKEEMQHLEQYAAMLQVRSLAPCRGHRSGVCVRVL
jgi:hypothetical protein